MADHHLETQEYAYLLAWRELCRQRLDYSVILADADLTIRWYREALLALEPVENPFRGLAFKREDFLPGLTRPAPDLVGLKQLLESLRRQGEVVQGLWKELESAGKTLGLSPPDRNF